MGFAVILGRIDAAALLLYAGSIAWVIAYDTIYAHQDTEDDVMVGIKSTALLFGARTQMALMIFYSLAVVLIGAALWRGGSQWPAWAGLAAFAAHLGWQVSIHPDQRLCAGACGCSNRTATQGCCCLPDCLWTRCCAPHGESASCTEAVMPGLVPGIHVFERSRKIRRGWPG